MCYDVPIAVPRPIRSWTCIMGSVRVSDSSHWILNIQSIAPLPVTHTQTCCIRLGRLKALKPMEAMVTK